MLRWYHVGEEVPERTLTMASTLSGEERRARPREPAARGPTASLLAPLSPHFDFEPDLDPVAVRLQRRGSRSREVLQLVDLDRTRPPLQIGEDDVYASTLPRRHYLRQNHAGQRPVDGTGKIPPRPEFRSPRPQ